MWSSAVFFLWLSAPTPYVTLSSASTPIYTYTDDAGTQNFTTELDSIPEQYRDQVTTLSVETSPEPSPHTSPPVSAEPQPPSEQVRVVTASGEYRMGDHDTRTDAVRLAVEAAKREALEQVATYLENVTEVRNMDVTKDDIRTYTAGIVKVLDQTITMRPEGETAVIRADLTAQIDTNEVTRAIAALRENESARSELAALRVETDQLQQQLDTANQALAAATAPEEVQVLTQQREDMLNELHANALVSQAWTDWAYVTPGLYPYPWIGVQHVHGLLLQAQRFYPRHRHLPFAQQHVTKQTGTLQSAPPGMSSPPRRSLLVPSSPSVRGPRTAQPPGSRSPNAASGASASNSPTPTLSQRFSGSRPQIQQRMHPSQLGQTFAPVMRPPNSGMPRGSYSGPRYFGGGGRNFGGGSRFGGGGGGRFGGGRSGGGGRGGRR